MPPKKPHLFETIDSALPFILNEGSAKITFPNGKVFYNPVQQYNRDLSIAVIRTFLKTSSYIKEPTIYEGLSATGLRSIRYAKEIPGLSKVYANDLDPEAVKLLTENVKLNEVSERVIPTQGDANASLFILKSQGHEINVVDLDPYGSAAPFIDTAVQTVANGGLLCITCTDMAVLCASYPETCFAKYSSIPMKGDNSHEAALRIVLSLLESSATKYKRTIKPLLTLSIDFYMRTFVQINESPSGSKQSCSKKSYFSKCVQCGLLKDQKIVHSVVKGNSTVYSPAHISISSACDVCASKMLLHGPYWNAPIHDRVFIQSLLEEVKEMKLETKARIQGMVTVASEELDVPFFYSLPTISSFLKCIVPPLLDVHSAILNSGFKVSISHTCPTSVKTDAPAEIIWDIFREWIKMNPVKNTENVAATKILQNPSTHSVNFTRNPMAKAASKASGLTRFQENPTRNWGPLARAKIMLFKGLSNFQRFYSTKGLTKIYSLEGRYASALFNAAEKSKKIKEVELEISKVKSFILKNRDMQSFLENPSIGRGAKKDTVVSMLSKQKYSDLVVNFFKAMSDNGRLTNCLKIISTYEDIMKEFNSEVRVRVVSNQILTKEIQQKLEELVQKKFIPKGNTIHLDWKVDEKIKGGFIIEIGDNVIDMSVASKANIITKDLQNSI